MQLTDHLSFQDLNSHTVPLLVSEALNFNSWTPSFVVFLFPFRDCIQSCGQLLNVRVETSHVPQGSLRGLVLFNAFLRDMDRGIQCKPAGDTKLCGAAKMLEGWDTIQRDLDRPEKWVHVNLIDFSKDKVLHLGHDNLKHNYRMGGA